jgi:TPR repeat protein
LTADQGNADGQFHYGVFLMTGDGIPMDKSFAAHYSKLAADQGMAKAQFNYGVLLEDGDGIPMAQSLSAH